MTWFLYASLALVCVVLPHLLLGMYGIYILSTWWRGKKKSQDSLTWQETKGEVIQSNISSKGGWLGDDEYFPEVRFSYAVGGEVFEGCRFSVGNGSRFLTYQEAERVLEYYQPGDTVPVYYDPNKPDEAVLVREPQGIKRGLIIGSVILAYVVCIMCALVVFLFILLAS